MLEVVAEITNGRHGFKISLMASFEKRIYGTVHKEGYVSVGISADTAQFAVNIIRSWWNEMGLEKYPAADRLLITADGGGSNGSRNRLWKTELQKFADGARLDITVCHFPPGTSKWNKIEYRSFSQITKNWRGVRLKHWRSL